MNCHYQKNECVSLSRCDASGRLSIPDVFAAFQDIATEHAEILGVGGPAMAAKNLFWLTARTKIHVIKRPAMLNNYTLETWPAAPGNARCDRFYRAMANGETILEGRTEWAVWDFVNNRTVSAKGLFSEELEFDDERVLDGPFARFRHDFSDDDVILRHTVVSGDIDIGNHMNNVAYPRLLINSFTAEEIKKIRLQNMEVLFMIPCLEGEELSVARRETENGYEFGIRKVDGRYAALASIILKK